MPEVGACLNREEEASAAPAGAVKGEERRSEWHQGSGLHVGTLTEYVIQRQNPKPSSKGRDSNLEGAGEGTERRERRKALQSALLSTVSRSERFLCWVCSYRGRRSEPLRFC